jgi:hypothetical protein
MEGLPAACRFSFISRESPRQPAPQAIGIKNETPIVLGVADAHDSFYAAENVRASTTPLLEELGQNAVSAGNRVFVLNFVRNVEAKRPSARHLNTEFYVCVYRCVKPVSGNDNALY